MTLEEKLEAVREEADRIVRAQLPDPSGYPGKLIEAMNYSISVGGKRTRPILMLLAFRLFEGEGPVIEPFMAAIEMIHTHSLIHDDLPAIDNDSFRRGAETVHAKYGEALGILSGDALLNIAYERAVSAFEMGREPEKITQALQILTRKTGIGGMLGGQGLDVENEKNGYQKMDREMLDLINRKKTSALLEAALMIGACLAGAASFDVAKMEEIGRKIGAAFQIRDDILDVTGDESLLGKKTHVDERNEKTTYATLLGISGASELVATLTDEATGLLETIPGDKELLAYYLQRLAGREN